MLDSPICPSCGKPSPRGMVHRWCPKRGKLDGLTSYYHYSGWAKELVRDAKFGRVRRWGAMKKLAEEFGAALQSTGDSLPSTDPDRWVIVPVPLHWWRERKRGFNQAGLIARQLARILDWPIEEKLLKRIRYTEAQTLTEKKVKLSKEVVKKLEKKYRSEVQRERVAKKLRWKETIKRRRKNVAGAFQVSGKWKVESGKLIYKNVFLVDDVWTTGATMQEAAGVLKAAGVKTVWGVTLLRA